MPNKAACINIGEIFKSNNSGDFKIIEDLGMINHTHYIIIEFCETGFRKKVRYTDAKKGEVKDPTNYKSKVSDTIYTSNNYGEFRIIEDYGTYDVYGNRKVLVEFINTGSKVITTYNSATSGEVKDPVYDNIDQYQFLNGATPIINIRRELRKTWYSMMARCYNKNFPNYKSYGARGITVCEEWHNFENFANDAVMLPGWDNKLLDPYHYHLDKDYLQQDIPTDKKVYSKHTCIWLYSNDNTNERILNNSNKYIGVRMRNNLYYCAITVNGNMMRIGPFDSDIAAANTYNILSSKYKSGNIPVINNVPFMHPSEIIKHNLNPKEMCKIID